MEFFAGIGLRKNKQQKEKELAKEMMDMNMAKQIGKLNADLKQRDAMITGLSRTIAQLNIEIKKLQG